MLLSIYFFFTAHGICRTQTVVEKIMIIYTLDLPVCLLIFVFFKIVVVCHSNFSFVFVLVLLPASPFCFRESSHRKRIIFRHVGKWFLILIFFFCAVNDADCGTEADLFFFVVVDELWFCLNCLFFFCFYFTIHYRLVLSCNINTRAVVIMGFCLRVC